MTLISGSIAKPQDSEKTNECSWAACGQYATDSHAALPFWTQQPIHNLWHGRGHIRLLWECVAQDVVSVYGRHPSPVNVCSAVMMTYIGIAHSSGCEAHRHVYLSRVGTFFATWWKKDNFCQFISFSTETRLKESVLGVNNPLVEKLQFNFDRPSIRLNKLKEIFECMCFC